jgi:hypothetical protein
MTGKFVEKDAEESKQLNEPGHKHDQQAGER